MSDWIVRLEADDLDGAWDRFVEQYRRVIFGAIRHYTTEHDEVMDVFALVCESLRENDLARLRRYLADGAHTARFSTWLVAVVRNVTVDWFRHRDGRKRLSAIAAKLPPLQRRIFECVFVEGHSHIESYERLLAEEVTVLSFGAFLRELRATYVAIAERRKGALMAELWGPLPPPEIESVLVDASHDAEYGALLAEALESLAPDDRLAIQLFVVDELPAPEVARILGFPNAKSVYNHVYRALADLRARLERLGVSRVDF